MLNTQHNSELQKSCVLEKGLNEILVFREKFTLLLSGPSIVVDVVKMAIFFPPANHTQSLNISKKIYTLQKCPFGAADKIKLEKVSLVDENTISVWKRKTEKLKFYAESIACSSTLHNVLNVSRGILTEYFSLFSLTATHTASTRSIYIGGEKKAA